MMKSRYRSHYVCSINVLIVSKVDNLIINSKLLDQKNRIIDMDDFYQMRNFIIMENMQIKDITDQNIDS